MRPKYLFNKGLIIQKSKGKLIIFNGKNTTIYSLNDTAAYILLKIRAKLEKQAIANLVVRKYKIDQKTAFNDVSDFINELLKNKIISIS